MAASVAAPESGSRRARKLALRNTPIHACTALVNSEAISGGRPTLSRRAGTTAEAENHSDMVATAQKAMITSERVRTDKEPSVPSIRKR